MNLKFYQSAGYVPSGGTKLEKPRQQKQWEQRQGIQQRPRQSLGDMVNQPFATSNPASRDGADYVQSQTSTEQRARSHLDDAGHGRRMRSSSSEHSNNSWQTTSESRGELRMSSAHFNSPTAVELERVKDHRKSARGMRKLKSVVKGWVKL